MRFFVPQVQNNRRLKSKSLNLFFTVVYEKQLRCSIVTVVFLSNGFNSFHFCSFILKEC